MCSRLLSIRCSWVLYSPWSADRFWICCNIQICVLVSSGLRVFVNCTCLSFGCCCCCCCGCSSPNLSSTRRCLGGGAILSGEFRFLADCGGALLQLATGSACDPAACSSSGSDIESCNMFGSAALGLVNGSVLTSKAFEIVMRRSPIFRNGQQLNESSHSYARLKHAWLTTAHVTSYWDRLLCK